LNPGDGFEGSCDGADQTLSTCALHLHNVSEPAPKGKTLPSLYPGNLK
jgi:hypothetical protein